MSAPSSNNLIASAISSPWLPRRARLNSLPADDIAGAGDEFIESGDEVVGTVDDVPASRLPHTDPQVIDEIDQVGGPALDGLQTEVD